MLEMKIFNEFLGHLIVDLDNTLVNFFGNNKELALSQFEKVPDFFEWLKPLRMNLTLFKTLSVVLGTNKLVIISRAPSVAAAHSKMKWCQTFIPKGIKVVFMIKDKAPQLMTQGDFIFAFGYRSKYQVANALGIRGCLFDDNPREVQDWNEDSVYGAYLVKTHEESVAYKIADGTHRSQLRDGYPGLHNALVQLQTDLKTKKLFDFFFGNMFNK